ncbi:MAG: GNAT family N-acetyltransferase [Candidatus Harrisonbacteria bacterium]|nr:GNAT family N-acetyltransferase [Candidatus Harrisonbacteria bacterium]
MEEKQKVVFLKGKKVILRPLNKETDLEHITRWINDHEVTQYLTIYLPTTRKNEEGWLDSLNKDKENIVLAIETLDGKFIGTMGIHQINWKDRTATTGALIGEKEYWGKGYGTDAKMLLLEYAFHTLNLRKICSVVFSFNKRSLRYSLHCGYKIEGTKRKQMFRKGRYWDEIILGLFKEEWLPIWRRYRKTGRIR